MMSQTVRFCPDCSAEQVFEQLHAGPGCCPDTSDGSCFEWYCTDCGSAYFFEVVPLRLAAAFIEMPGRVA
ncbi:MAG TPA: hypothetical protein VG253_13790 [Streptosporangiaceae bacterium]|jgi:hypothetical protein|nr:hypothetical protein [Streptosporangiaceae bacterium]